MVMEPGKVGREVVGKDFDVIKDWHFNTGLLGNQRMTQNTVAETGCS